MLPARPASRRGRSPRHQRSPRFGRTPLDRPPTHRSEEPARLATSFIVDERRPARARRASTTTTTCPRTRGALQRRRAGACPRELARPCLLGQHGRALQKGREARAAAWNALRRYEQRPRRAVHLPWHQGRVAGASTSAPDSGSNRRRRVAAAAPGRTTGAGGEHSTAARPAAAASLGYIDGGGHTGLACVLALRVQRRARPVSAVLNVRGLGRVTRVSCPACSMKRSC